MHKFEREIIILPLISNGEEAVPVIICNVDVTGSIVPVVQ